MCIIIAKDKSGRIPTIEELTNSFTYNSDGAGFMYVKNDKVVIDKGYMKLTDFLDRFKELCEEFNDFKNKSLVIHCRIGTSSGNTPENTHPYPISGKVKDLHKTHIECDLGMAHNGIIHDYTPSGKKPNTNDTQEFILKYVNKLYDKWEDFYKDKYILSGMEDITNSKLVFMNTSGDLYYVGEFVEDEKLKFSNTSYKSYSYYKTGKSYYTNHYDWYEDDYEHTPSYGEVGSKYIGEHIKDSDWWYLDSSWWIVIDGVEELVGDRDLMWDWSTLDLVQYDEKSDDYKLIGRGVIVLDADGEEIY